MGFEITCPYCFKKFTDSDVHFRSERVSKGAPEMLPEEYYDLEDFQARYQEEDKEELLSQLQAWEFFAEADDPYYTRFWEDYGGTTEQNPADKVLQVEAYRRRVLNPADLAHQKYLRRQNDEEFLIRDSQGMAAQIELLSGERCSRRVCPSCHNPLPDNYGKNPVKFATIIGITGSGKTVYISRLLRDMKKYAVKAGLTAIVSSPSVVTFLENNAVEAGEALPSSTPAGRLQQPLFYELVRDNEGSGKITETFVLYDVAGEVFSSSELVNRFAPFVEKAHGVILLIDPMQFDAIRNTMPHPTALSNPAQVLDVIHNIVSHGDTDKKCDTPFAVCISKIDIPPVQKVLHPELLKLLLDDVHGVEDPQGAFYRPLFNAAEYNPISKYLIDFFQQNAVDLAQQMRTNYSTYAYFAFTALGCPVKTEQQGSSPPIRVPQGPVLPKRIEEPLLWLFHELHYINANEPITVPSPKQTCPNCGSQRIRKLLGEDRFERFGFLRRKVMESDYQCSDCGTRW